MDSMFPRNPVMGRPGVLPQKKASQHPPSFSIVSVCLRRKRKRNLLSFVRKWSGHAMLGSVLGRATSGGPLEEDAFFVESAAFFL